MTERFDCHHCEDSLFGRKYVLREEQPYCVACFEALFASTCEECGKLIGCDCKVRRPLGGSPRAPHVLPCPPASLGPTSAPHVTLHSWHSSPGPHHLEHSRAPFCWAGTLREPFWPPLAGLVSAPSQSHLLRAFRDVCARRPRYTSDGSRSASLSNQTPAAQPLAPLRLPALLPG